MQEFQLYTLLLTLVATICAWYFIRRLRSGGGDASPPSPPSLPVIGNLHQLGHLPHRSLYNLSRKYGPLMLLHFGSKPTFVVSSAEIAKEILKNNDLAFADKAATINAKKIFYDLKDVLTLPYGEQWRKLRSIVVQELLSNSRVKSFRSIMEEEVALLMKSIEDSRFSSRGVNLTNEFAALSNDLITRAALGKKSSEIDYVKKFFDAVSEAGEVLGNFSVGDFIPWLGWIDRLNGRRAAMDRSVEIRDETLDAIIEHHLKSPDTSKENVMEILLGIYKGGSPGVSIDLISVKSVILDVFAAGTETTSATLVWIMTELLNHPTVMKKLQDEIRDIMGEKHRITDDDLQKMNYLKSVIKETLRLHPPVTIYIRAAREYVSLLGYEIAPETWVVINAWAIGRDPACWDEPEKFLPERFLNSSVDFKGFDFELIPFGAGRRICPGLGFATVSVEYTIANLMLKFDWALPSGAREEDLDYSERPGISVGKRTPLLVVPTIYSTA